MTFKDFFNQNKETTKHLLKIVGVIFTAIYAFIAIITGTQGNGIIETLKLFAYCFMAGNIFALFIWLLAISTAYGSAKGVLKIFQSFSQKEKEQYGIKIVRKPLNPKFNYIQFNLIASKAEVPIVISLDKEGIAFTILNDLSEIQNFQSFMFKMSKKYKKKNISLTGWGFKKTINLKKWHKDSEGKLPNIIAACF